MIEELARISTHCLVGSGLILVAAVAGWWEGRHRRRWPARLMAWWLDCVVRPLLASRSMGRRTAIIAGNNSATCAMMVLLGACGAVALLAVAAVGCGLGLALRLMAPDTPPAAPAPDTWPPTRGQRVAAVIGVGLNLLEIPAIALGAGLCLAQAVLSPTIEWAEAWSMYGRIVLPTLVVAAAGEALWMGIYPPTIHDSGK